MGFKEMLELSPCDYADALPREQFVDYAIKPLHEHCGKIAGPAFTVYCEAGDHLMLHAAIYRAKPGDIIVVQADDSFAVAGGNVCMIAQAKGIAGFIVDGVIRDLAEVRECKFPVFARGVIPKPGKKAHTHPLNQPIVCGGVNVNAGDHILADEEGIAVVPSADAESAYQTALARAQKDGSMTLEQWEAQHVATVQKKLDALGFSEN